MIDELTCVEFGLHTRTCEILQIFHAQQCRAHRTWRHEPEKAQKNFGRRARCGLAQHYEMWSCSGFVSGSHSIPDSFEHI